MALLEAAATQVEAAAKSAGLAVIASEPGEAYSGIPTTRFRLALAADPAKTQLLELSQTLAFDRPELVTALNAFLAESAKRLRNPRPDCYVTLHGLPVSFGRFEWPFHRSTSGADTSIVHGEVRLEDGSEPVLHAKVSASMTVTFQEIVIPEQPFSESFIYNAVRKTFDQGQLELVKSGNRQPVPVTMRYYSTKQRRFVFNDTTPDQRKTFLAAKAFWLSGVLGGGAPVWMLDPRDAQYLNASVDDLRTALGALRSEGLITPADDAEFAAAAPALQSREQDFRAELAHALAFLKPSFNEEMRAGHTNM